MRAVLRWASTVVVILLSAAMILTAGAYYGGQALVARYIPVLETAIFDATGLQVHLPNVRVVVLPRLRIISKDASIKSRTQAGGITADISIPTLHLELSWLPLLHREIVFHTVLLKAPRINLYRPSASSLAETFKGTASSPAPERGNSSADASTPQLRFNTARFPHILLRDGALRLFDNAGNSELAVSDIHLDGELSIKGPTSLILPSLKAHALLTQTGAAALPAPINLQFDTKIVGEAGLVSAFPLDLSFQRSSFPALPALQISANQAMVFDLSTHQFKASDLSIQLGQSRVKLAAEGVVDTGEGTLSLEASNLETRSASIFVAPFFPHLELPSAWLDGQLSLRRGIEGTIRATGQTTIRHINSSGFSSDESRFAEISITATRDGSVDFESGVQLRRLAFTTADREHYGSNAARGTFRIARSSAGRCRIDGELTIEGFSYSDSDLTLKDIDAKLTKIRAEVESDGSGRISANLLGSRVTLTDPTVTVSGARQLQAPLQVEIGSSGGYLVSGPITVKNASGTAAGFALEQAGGVIDMRLSPESKRFTSRKLSASLGGEKVEASADFEVLSDSYVLHHLHANAFGGTIVGSLSYGKHHHQEVQARLEAREVSLDRSLPSLLPQRTELPKGVLAELTVEGRSVKSALIPNFDGTGKILVRDGLVSRIGVDAALARTLQTVPIVGSQFQFVEPAHKESNAAEGLALRPNQSRELSATFKASQNRITWSDLIITGRSGTVKLSGSYDFSAGFAAEGQVIFLEKTLTALAGPLQPLGRVMGSLGRIEIPIELTGPVGNPRVRGLPSRVLSVTGPTRMLSDVVDGTVGALGKLVRPRPTP